MRALVALSEPDPARAAAPAVRPAAGDLPALLDRADRHSVLPAVLRNLRAMGLGGEALTPGRRRLLERTALSLRLRGQLAEILPAMASEGVAPIILKGPTFADRLYGEPSLRPFTDLDLLVARDAWPAADRAMASLGYRPGHEAGRKHAGAYGEETYRRDASAGAVELHWNLVNSPALRPGLSVTWEDLGGGGELSPEALLTVAAVHGAASHQFDRLGLLWDVALAVRGAAGPVDAGALRSLLDRTGAARAMRMALHLADAVLGEQAARALAARLALGRPDPLERALLTPAVVLDTDGRLAVARRLGFRQRLKRRL
ncbi:MAG: nucleotidyltransferase family protein [Planctomycetes bacterium]|nr:nucleotidyltransferase family protein [Planctomycetota bacterium]